MTHSLDLAGVPAHDYRLAKVLGVLAVTASAVAAEYGAGINFVSTQSLGVYPGVHGLVPWAMFVTGVLMLPKTYLFVMFSRVMPRAGSKYVWIAVLALARRYARARGDSGTPEQPVGRALHISTLGLSYRQHLVRNEGGDPCRPRPRTLTIST